VTSARETEPDVKLPLILPTGAAADRDAALAVEYVKLLILDLKAARRQGQLDQMRKIPLVHASSGLSLAAVHSVAPSLKSVISSARFRAIQARLSTNAPKSAIILILTGAWKGRRHGDVNLLEMW
jgi:hypothetical protein